MTLEEELRRARDAEQLVNSPLFQEAKKNIEDQLGQLRRDVSIYSTEMHTRLILMEQIYRRFCGYFDQLIQTGKFAQMKLLAEERKRTMKEQAMALVSRVGRNAW